MNLKLQIEESTKVEEILKDTINIKIEENEKLEQELFKMRAKEKVSESSALLDKLLTMQKSHKDKGGLGFFGECSKQNDKSKAKEKMEVEKKLEDSNKVRNSRPTINRPSF